MRRRCEVEGCDRLRFGHGYCNAHYKRWRKTGSAGPVEIRQGPREVCSVVDCVRTSQARGYCHAHYERWRLSGTAPDTPINQMEFKGLAGPCLRPNCSGMSRGSGYCNKHYARLRVLLSYGMSGWDEFDTLWGRSEGRCEICSVVLDPDSKDTHVDHCHVGLTPRGILCRNCNFGIGNFQDNPEYLELAAQYLRDRRTA